MAKKKKAKKKKTPQKKRGLLKITRKKKPGREALQKKQERAYKSKLPKIEQRTDAAGRVYYVDTTNGGKISRDEFLRNSFKKSLGPRKWYAAYKKYLGEKKAFTEAKKPAKKKLTEAGPGEALTSEYYINLDVLNVIDENIKTGKDPITVIYYNRKRKLGPRKLDEFKAVLQDFIGDWYSYAAEQYDGSLPYYVELQNVFSADYRDLLRQFIDFNKQAETNKDVMDLAALESYSGKKRKIDLDFLDIRKYLDEAGF